MSIDEIRQQKGRALLEFQEAGERLSAAKVALKDMSARLERLSRLITVEEPRGRKIEIPHLDSPHWLFVTEEAFRAAIAAYNEAMDALAEATAKKQELGL